MFLNFHLRKYKFLFCKTSNEKGYFFMLRGITMKFCYRLFSPHKRAKGVTLSDEGIINYGSLLNFKASWIKEKAKKYKLLDIWNANISKGSMICLLVCLHCTTLESGIFYFIEWVRTSWHVKSSHNPVLILVDSGNPCFLKHSYFHKRNYTSTSWEKKTLDI